MSIDAYSPCPGGTDKKIKFCCGGDFLPELQKIDRMVEGEQYLACLKYLDDLLEKKPDRACLLAIKCNLLRATDQLESARQTATFFSEKHPDNQVALAELAMLAPDARAALDYMLRAMKAAQGNVSGRTYQALGLTAGAMLQAGFPLSAHALLQLQLDLVEDDNRPAQLLVGLNRAGDVPLLLRDPMPLVPCSDDAPWKDRFHEAMQAIMTADWRAGEERLSALSAEAPDESVVWHNLAVVRGWLADNDGAIEALRRYAALRAAESDGLDDAVEAEAAAMFLADDPLGDRLEVYTIEWTVRDAERAGELSASSPRFRAVSFDPAQFSDGQTPPPRAAYMLLDRPAVAEAEGLTLDSMPRLLGQALLFGRQTDRQAYLDILGVDGNDLSAVKTLMSEALGESIAPQPAEPTVVGHVSATQKLLRVAWQPPRDISADQYRALMDQHRRKAILEDWPELKLGALDGRSPREAAGVESLRIRLLAAIMVLEHWAARLPGETNFNELRTRLGLPALGPLNPAKHPVAELPAARLSRVAVDGLSDQDLTLAMFRAEAFGVRRAVKKFAEAIVARPSMADADQRLHAFAALARNEEDVARALDYIDRGRKAAEGRKHSSASWDLIELSLRLATRDGREAMRLIEHLQNNHLEEPGIGASLTHMLIEVGLLRPDGTPAIGPEMVGAEPLAAEPSAAEPCGLWTPDGAQPAAGAGKLWTPD